MDLGRYLEKMRIIRKIYLLPLYKKEEKFFFWLARKVSPWMHPDVATALAILSALSTFLLLILFPSRYAYLYTCPLILMHYIFDSVDGKIARVRHLNRPIGSLIDKLSDTVCSVLFASGLFLRIFPPIVSVYAVVFLLGLNGVRFLLSYHKKIEIKAGGTEGRILFVALCLWLFFSGWRMC